MSFLQTYRWSNASPKWGRTVFIATRNFAIMKIMIQASFKRSLQLHLTINFQKFENYVFRFFFIIDILAIYLLTSLSSISASIIYLDNLYKILVRIHILVFYLVTFSSTVSLSILNLDNLFKFCYLAILLSITQKTISLWNSSCYASFSVIFPPLFVHRMT